jgi:ATP-binding cassette, subfamily G (WHITE), member 2, SNQ2
LLENKWDYWSVFVAFRVSNLVLVYFFTGATKVKGWNIFYFFYNWAV